MTNASKLLLNHYLTLLRRHPKLELRIDSHTGVGAPPQVHASHSVRRAAVVGMTTTALAHFSALVSAMGVEVIVVEEATEVLESHVIAALSPATRHLVLFGDQKQLRPSSAVAKLSQQFRCRPSVEC